MPSSFMASTSRISTSTPSCSSSLTRSANSTGPSTLAGSLTRSRAKKTPLATALRGWNAAFALSGWATWMTSFFKPSLSGAASSFDFFVKYFLKL